MLVFVVLKNDGWIRRMARQGMIEPYVDSLRSKGVISAGISSYGYDMRISNEFRIFRATGGVVDPKAMDGSAFEDFTGEVCVIPPNSFVLGRSVEYFRIPRDVLAICLGKSTYARCGIIVNVTPLEPEWEGHVTVAICNTAPLPARIYANEGLAQLVFLSAEEVCETSYSDRSGKYQAQGDITLSRTS
jgi:dCTP deaminase